MFLSDRSFIYNIHLSGSLSVADQPDDDEEEEQLLRHMGCNSCIHPTCKQGLIANSICRCPNTDSNAEQCDGLLVLDVNSKPNWKLACNVCNTLIRFRAEIHLITPQMQCSECGVRTAIFEFNKNKTPLPNGKKGCV